MTLNASRRNEHLRCTVERTKDDGKRRVSHCPAHDDEHPSLLVKVSRSGDWINVNCLSGCDFRDVKKALADLQIDSRINQRSIVSQDRELAKENWRRQNIYNLLAASKKVTEDDFVDRYFKARKIDLAPYPDDLLFCSRCPYFKENKHVLDYPALIATIRNAENEIVSLHRTYLTANGRKAYIDPARKVMSAIRRDTLMGAAIKLYAPEDGILAVAEGIETSLAVKKMTNFPVWSTVSANGMRFLDLPEGLKLLYVFADNDESKTGEEAAKDLALKAYRSGIQTKIITAPMPNQDWQDVLRNL